jgi:hypothetical protein
VSASRVVSAEASFALWSNFSLPGVPCCDSTHILEAPLWLLFVAVLGICISCEVSFIVTGSWIATAALLEPVNIENYESFACRICAMASLIALSPLEKTTKNVTSWDIDIWSGYIIAQPFPICVLEPSVKMGMFLIGFLIFDCRVGGKQLCEFSWILQCLKILRWQVECSWCYFV